MIKVYFESRNHAELVAVFDNEQTYNICLPSLEKEAEKARMIVTESVIDECDIDELLEINPNEKAIIWSTADFESRAESNFKELKEDNPEEFAEFESWEQLYDKTKFPQELQNMISAHDCNFGITWETVDAYIGNCEIKTN